MENLAPLKTSLRHWQTWDAEYEGLKEDLDSLDDAAGLQEIIRLAAEFGGDLVTENEIRHLAGVDKGSYKDTRQIIGIIERRQECKHPQYVFTVDGVLRIIDVQRNISTITKQLAAAQAQLDGSKDDQSIANGDSVLPISEIVEQLDDDDNVISSRVVDPRETADGLVETLRKAGVSQTPGPTLNHEKSGSDITTSRSRDLDSELSQDPVVSTTNAIRTTGPQTLTQQVQSASVDADAERPTRKAPLTDSVSPSLLKGSFSEGDRVIELNDDDEFIGSTAVMPTDESPEDAQLRREMLSYHLNEVGNVVAEMDILEGESDDEDYEDLEDLDDVSETSDMSEVEDEHGRSLRSALTDDYVKQMKDLERRLTGNSMKNLGPQPEGVVLPGPSATADSTLREAPPRPQQSRETTATAKSVRFAADLDVSPAPAEMVMPQVQNKPGQPRETHGISLSSTVKERPSKSADDHNQDPVISKPTKVSRFKQGRVAEPPNTKAPVIQSTSEPTLTISESVLERATTRSPASPLEPDELDPEIHRRQLTAEYYRMRNKMIQQEGGFKMTEEDKETPLMEEQEDGKLQKVSRFKAARLKR
ncbi:hypothetical protein CAC42_6321 [Sphaceloma murrayae]|uniref:DUF3835 domain-containing protein n=1 Tax=Sphaceloma murrayae TaxID=2082308 RepID=A0A2K1QM25_9PEZI|nr:hypothetical protein CAC42_6321 [Sphaceloma murrayae]